MKTITIDGHLRTENGKKVARQLRSQDNVLAVIYGGATEVNFYAPAKAFKSLVYTSEFQLADVTVEGKTYKCILKDLQFDKVTDALLHVDLLELVNDKKVIATLPLKMVGVSVGVKAGGKLIVKMKSLKVKALPKEAQTVVVNETTNNYYYAGTYYEKKGDEYVVVPPTAGTVVENLPEGGEEVKIGDVTYVQVGKTYYQPIKKDGKEMYEVVNVEKADEDKQK